MSETKGLFWCPIRKGYQKWEEHISFYRNLTKEEMKAYAKNASAPQTESHSKDQQLHEDQP